MKTILRVTQARKRFGNTEALKGASIELREGELLALLGPNGAGKTTLIRSISGRVHLDSGDIELFGEKLAHSQWRDTLAVVPQEIALYSLLTARENLEAFGTLFGVPKRLLAEKVEWALDWTGLKDRAREPIQTFSGGMKRRLNLACAILHSPKVLLLDEPTVGVDPQSREKIYDMLAKLRAEGMSLLLTTHHLEEAEARCERIVIIDHGVVVAAGTLPELVRQTVTDTRTVTFRLDRPTAETLRGFEPIGESSLSAAVHDVATELPGLIQRIQLSGCRIENLEVRSPSLQSVFIHLTGKDLRE